MLYKGGKVRVTVKLFATLREYAPSGSAREPLRAEIRDGGSVTDLVRILHIPKDLPRIVMVNSRPASLESALEEGDTVSLFPAIGGG